MEKQIENGLIALGLTPPPGAAAKLARYGLLLLEKNQVMNLTAITEPRQVADLHFLDSAALLKAAPLANASLIDVGTGAGFPGLALKILEPTLRLTLLDGLQKRLDWLAQVCEELDVKDVTFLHARAEEESLKPGLRDSFDFATARAVAGMNVLCELCMPYVKVGGRFLAMKSVDCEGELSLAANAVGLLSGRLLPSLDYEIPGSGVFHRVVVVEKCAPTPKGYPRRWAKIQKAPL